MSKLLFSFFLPLFLCCTFACQEKKAAVSPENTSWQLKQLVSGSGTENVPAGTNISATFKDGKLTGKGGCNTYSTDYTLSGNRLKFTGQVMSTKMACPANNWEAKYFEALHGEQTWTISGNTLKLQSVEAVTLVFEKP